MNAPNPNAMVVWALPAGQTDRLYEQVMAECTTQEQVERVKAAASVDGWHSFRVAKLGGLPDFQKVF